MNRILVLIDFKGVKAQQYDRVMDEINSQNAMQNNGCISHTACATSYGMKIVDVWESESKFKKFGDILMPILKKQGVPNAEPQIFPVHNFVLAHSYAT